MIVKGQDGGAAPPSPLRIGLIILLYLCLNSTLNLLNRYTLGHAGFRYPVSLTCFHLAFQLCSLTPLLMRPPYAGTHREHLSRSWKPIALIGVFMGLNIGLNNASLLHLSLSFNQIIRASIPVVCAVCAVFVEKKVPTPAEVRAKV
jgi:drug/metabolite transporter (DMT)-like permease